VTARLEIAAESWPIRGRFTISRGSRTEAEVVVATIARDGHVGRGECVPYGRYGETVEGVVATLRAEAAAVAAGLDRETLRHTMPAGAARNALDCALWDLEAKASGRPAHELAGLAGPKPLTTAFTLSLGEPAKMAADATAAADRPLLKLKLGGDGDAARVAAVRAARPDARLIVDANEAWRRDALERNLAAMAAAAVELVEQPLPADDDLGLAEIARPVPVCADEAAHTAQSLDRLRGKYDMVNIKLDKTGGLTEALDFAAAARAVGLRIMVGCMVGTSLAMAPAVLLGGLADFVDLDGPLLLARDREPGIRFAGGTLHPPPRALWG